VDSGCSDSVSGRRRGGRNPCGASKPNQLVFKGASADRGAPAFAGARGRPCTNHELAVRVFYVGGGKSGLGHGRVGLRADPSIAEALTQIERRYQPDDGQGRTFAALDAYGEATPDGKLHMS
jgi:hypothetical protein